MAVGTIPDPKQGYIFRYGLSSAAEVMPYLEEEITGDNLHGTLLLTHTE